MKRMRERRHGETPRKRGWPSKGDGEGTRGVKDRIHPRLVPVLFALIAPRYNGTLPELPSATPRYVRWNERRSGRELRLSRSGERQCAGNEKQEGPGAAAERKRRRGQSGRLSA